MKHLKKITISNARRFGKDVEIELSSGANIFLAPNGTGKTTLFEAIEFALTGSIQRLANPPLSLIRDNQNGVDVRLDFDNGNFCEVNYRKGEVPKLSGDHSLLFPKHTVKDIPFLLRITHLLEQRGSNWFIQKPDSSQAGDVLDKLSIGKDLSTIAKTKSNTLNAATRTINDRKEKRDAHRSHISFFEEKLKARDAAGLNYTLKPLNEILDQINIVHKLFDDSYPPLQEEQNVDSIISYKGLVNNIAIKSDDDNKNKSLFLSSIESRIPLFHSNKIEIEKREKDILEKEGLVSKLSGEIGIIKEDILKLQESLNKSNGIKAGLQTTKQLSNRKKEEEAKCVVIEGQINSVANLILEHRRNFEQANELIDKINTRISEFNLIRQREQDAIRRKGELSSFQSTVDEWKSHQNRVNEVTGIIADLMLARKEYQEKVNEAIAEELLAGNRLKDSQNRLNSLKSASDAIMGAVGIISSNIAEDQGQCPVCSAGYTPSELRDRINLALQKIDPLLGEEIEKNKTLQLELEGIQNSLRDVKSNLDQTATRLAENEALLKSAQSFINEQCIPKFNGKENIQEAELWLKSEKDTNDTVLQTVIADKSNFGEEPSTGDLSLRISTREQINTEIQSFEKNFGTLTASLEDIKSNLERINKELLNTDLEKLEENIAEIENDIQKILDVITTANRTREQREKYRKDTEEEIADLKMTASKLQGQQNEILTEWEKSGLRNGPSMEELSRGKRELAQKSEIIKQSIGSLDKIGEELGRWAAAEKFDALDKEIKLICGNLDEQSYLAELKTQEKSIEEELSLITERKKALDTLYSQINRELETIHEQIKSINPFWVSLLKRIVVNPRFVDTHLDSYSYRNKPQAEVLINLHEKLVSVMDVASEAQATDLQLTFMLSMASRYRWSTWKSLLLDDPTQHHDLVHASGVFDLLRDYITDQEFQILMGTHDTVQGKFFQRKLQNENIDVKLWRLIANENGVRAEIIN